ncbi:MAG: hypothetical protein NC048_10385, partial [Bacteroides sp.]|nr:hypothetical protein [Bacteroides sp.]
MKFFRKLFLASLLLGSAGVCLEAQPAAQDRVIQGKKARIIVLERAAGADGAYLSRNEKYVFGPIGDNEGCFVYEIATGAMKVYEGFSIVEIVDTNNYVATNHIRKNGSRMEFKKGSLPTDAEHDYGARFASADLSVISYDTYIGPNYVSVIFDGDGNMIDTMPHYKQGLGAGYGSFVMAMSDDGRMTAGRTSIEYAFSNFTPAIWDRVADRTVATIEEIRTPAGEIDRDRSRLDGTLYGISRTGTIATGEIEEIPYWVEYDRNNAENPYVMHEIPLLPGYSMGWGTTVRGDIVQGTDQVDNSAVYERVPWLYNMKTGAKVTLNDHLLYRYGLAESSDYPYFTVISMSENGRIFAGYSYNRTWYPYVIILEDEQVHPVVRSVSVHQPFRQNYVQVQWQKPLDGDYTLAGYRVYRDSVLINTISDVNTLSYRDQTMENGRHNYQVQAFYTDGQASDYSAENNIIVVGENGCLPVLSIDAEVEYNRTVNLSWGLPSANLSGQTSVRVERNAGSRMSVGAAGRPAAHDGVKYRAEGGLDYVGRLDMNSQNSGAAVRAGDYIYVGDFRSGEIKVYDAVSGNLLENVAVSGLYGMYDMTYHDNTLYCVNNTNNVRELTINPDDPFDISLGNMWTAKSQLTHICYLEGLNGGKDMILTGNWNSLLFYNTDPADSTDLAEGDFAGRFDIRKLVIIGSAYHDGRLYFANQDDGNSSLVETYDWETGRHLFTTDLVAIPEIAELVDAQGGYSALAAGLSIGSMEDGTVVADAMIQPLVTYNQLVTVEIE